MTARLHLGWCAAMLVVVANASLAAEPVVVISDGNSLLRICRIAIDVYDGRPAQGNAVEQGAASIACANFMQGVTHTNLFYQAAPRAAPAACLPNDGISNGQAARIVIKFYQENPEHLHEPAALGTIYALSKAFPCRR